jgi:CP family cyanate transporter-like MFS transporter
VVLFFLLGMNLRVGIGGIPPFVLLGLPLVCVGGSLLMLLADPLGSDPYAVAVLGLGVGGSTALGIALISRVSGGRVVASSVGGIVYTIAFACSSVGPVALGELHDRTGSYTAGFAALAVLTIAALVASSWLKPGVTVKACAAKVSQRNC